MSSILSSEFVAAREQAQSGRSPAATGSSETSDAGLTPSKVNDSALATTTPHSKLQTRVLLADNAARRAAASFRRLLTDSMQIAMTDSLMEAERRNRVKRAEERRTEVARKNGQHGDAKITPDTTLRMANEEIGAQRLATDSSNGEPTAAPLMAAGGC
ncbi:hypothetical protein [Bordetella sp. 02P26C-1]|uniref:hypothetical protein n=1 Tax=Bordetella sp. 02P26C-1 TaxID=2683195 RepID=UPI001354351F|nr:hypothetical protein [Bordetella sp. 02P26C-1]MVW77387.1 hypothetical protein [Bordetella sp. 02P26C-1]